MTLDLDELERIGKATRSEPPWEAVQDRYSSDPTWFIVYKGSTLFESSSCGTKEDALFVAAARNNWQAMIDRIRELEAIDAGHSEEIREYNVRISELEKERDGAVDLVRAEQAIHAELRDKYQKRVAELEADVERLTALVPTCVGCGTQDDLEYGPDPFASEIHHKADDVWECKGCRRESARDI